MVLCLSIPPRGKGGNTDLSTTVFTAFQGSSHTVAAMTSSTEPPELPLIPHSILLHQAHKPPQHKESHYQKPATLARSCSTSRLCCPRACLMETSLKSCSWAGLGTAGPSPCRALNQPVPGSVSNSRAAELENLALVLLRRVQPSSTGDVSKCSGNQRKKMSLFLNLSA